MRPVDYGWALLWVVLAFAARWYLTGTPPWVL
jgi:hypothetical protein